VSDTYAYEAFGTVIASTGTTPNDYRYSGEQYDPNLGFTYLRARYVNPGTGRFWTRDFVEGDRLDPVSLHKYTYVASNPINLADPSGLLFTSEFGYAAHAVIQAVYLADHPGDAVIVGPTKGVLGTLWKPDILNTTSKKFAEIKPLSQSGLAKGVTQLAIYYAAFGPFTLGYSSDITWQPSTPYAQVGSVPIVFFNVGGLVFYTDAVDNAEDVLALGTIAAVRQYILSNRGVLVRGFAASAGRIGTLATAKTAADTARLEQHVGIAVLLGLMGGI
jgi:RHS repeat-associated protein